jgi:Flp pilus assembly protein TadD
MIAKPLTPLEKFMRIATVGTAAALTLLVTATTLTAQATRAPVDPRSLQLLAQGRQLAAAGDLQGAENALESAVTVDPANGAAYRELGGLAEREGLPGKAIRFYRGALALEPNDVALLGAEGRALVAQGALDRARGNLAKIRTLCRKGCAEATTLAAVIAKGPPPTQLSQATPAPAATPTPQAN